MTSEKDLPSNQRWAIFYKRRRAYQTGFKDLDLAPVREKVMLYEANLRVHFDTRAFFAEVSHPERCLEVSTL